MGGFMQIVLNTNIHDSKALPSLSLGESLFAG